ncbi:MAG: glycosyltransferase [Chthoniobacterales bacterium]|nr:glycosyltransferase [Chthoniobacterales bacterium]
MRVLHTVDSLRSQTGGPARTVPALAKALAEHGLEVHLWTRDLPADLAAPPGVKLHTGPLGDLLGRNGLRPDILHDHGIWLRCNHEACILAAKSGIPRIVSPRGMLEPWSLRHRRWKKRFAWWIYQRRDLAKAAVLHATADAEAAQFRRLGLRNPAKIIPNGIDLPDARGASRASDRKRKALFLGRIHRKKGLPLLVEAWADLQPAGWMMSVVGPDEDQHASEVKELLRRNGIADSWEFMGEADNREKWSRYAEADLFILPSHSENFGMVVGEALAAGVPVITTKGCPWEGLRSHQCGWWVEATVGDLTAALREACALPVDALSAMGQRGRRWMESEFGWNKIAAEMAELYEEALKGRNP